MRSVGDSEIQARRYCRRTSVRLSVTSISKGEQIDDFRPPHLRVVGARDANLDPEEQALLSLLRSWQIRRAREAA